MTEAHDVHKGPNYIVIGTSHQSAATIFFPPRVLDLATRGFMGHEILHDLVVSISNLLIFTSVKEPTWSRQETLSWLEENFTDLERLLSNLRSKVTSDVQTVALSWDQLPDHLANLDSWSKRILRKASLSISHLAIMVNYADINPLNFFHCWAEAISLTYKITVAAQSWTPLSKVMEIEELLTPGKQLQNKYPDHELQKTIESLAFLVYGEQETIEDEDFYFVPQNRLTTSH